MSSSDDVIGCGLLIRPHEHVVVVHGRELNLTAREFGILMHLAEHPGWVYSAEQLSTDNEDADYSPESVSVLVSRIRRKLAREGAPNLIETVRGFGYRLCPPSRDGVRAVDPEEDGIRSLRDASWNLQEAILEVEHLGSEEQRHAAADALEAVRRTILEGLAE